MESRVSPADVAPREISETEFRLFRELIHRETGIALRETKTALVSGRLQKRLRLHGLATFLDYYDLLSREPEGGEMQAFVNAITTNKTSFYREAHHFEMVRRLVVRPAMERALRSGEKKLRLWSAACSTGQEAYTLAMSVAEELGAGVGSWDVRILATDIDTDVLEKAERGVYEEEACGGLSEERRRRWMQRGKAGLWRVKEDLRGMVRFRRLNFMDERWPMQRRFDAIFCRNVLIYFDAETQDTVLRKMAGLLGETGLLFVGHSEHLFRMGDVLEGLNGTVYRRRV